MKHLLTILAVAMTAVVMQVAGAADVSWTGTGGVVDWNAATWSTGTPPGDNDRVVFPAHQFHPDYTVTPPTTFAGVLHISNCTANVAGILPGHLKVVNSNHANFTLGGNGAIEAFDGLEPMLDPAYAGRIDIPAGCTFAPTANFPANATFMGSGRFAPATVTQLDNAVGFRGAIDLSKIGAVSVGQDPGVLLGRDVIFGDNVSVDNAKVMTTIQPLELGKASGWTFNSALSETNPECVPTMDADGTLVLPHVNGVQNKTSAFFGRRIRVNDTFAARFKVTIDRGTGICGFACVMHKGELTDVATGAYTTNGGAVPAACRGLAAVYYNNWGGNINVFSTLCGENFTSWGDPKWCEYLQGDQIGMSLKDGRPFDVRVYYKGGTMWYTLSKDGSTRTIPIDVRATVGDPRGALFGFVTHEDIQEPNTVRLAVTISDFEGWIASDDNGQWKADSDFAFGADNYHLYLDYKESADGDVKSFRGADALDAQGRLRLCEGMYWFGAAISKNIVPNNKKFRLNWTLDVGTTAGGGEHTDIGFGKLTDADIKTYYGNYEVADGSGYGARGRTFFTFEDPIKFCHSWYQHLFGMTRNWDTGTQTSHYTGTVEFAPVFKTANTTNTGWMYFDGASAYRTQMYNSSDNAVHTFTLTTTPDGTRRIVVLGDGSTSWACYTKNWLRDIALSFWDDAYVQKPFLRLAAPAGVVTMAGVGNYAPIELLTMDDTTSRIKFTGTVAFGATLTIVVPDNYLKDLRTEAQLIDLSAATLSGSLPTTVTLVDSTGAAIPMRGRALTVNVNGIGLSGPRGLIVVVK